MPSSPVFSMEQAAGSMEESGAAASFVKKGQSFDFPGRGSPPDSHDRWRELFPLPASSAPSARPGASTCSRRRLAKVRNRVDEVNAITGCLNEMYHAGKPKHGNLETTNAQHNSQHSLFKQLQRRPPVRHACTEREAVQELLQQEVAYTGEAVTL